jgi:hypothetical protein
VVLTNRWSWSTGGLYLQVIFSLGLTSVNVFIHSEFTKVQYSDLDNMYKCSGGAEAKIHVLERRIKII